MWLAAVLGFGAVVNTAKATDPRTLDPSVVTSAVVSVTKGETVRIVPGASGFNIYGNRKSGSVVSSANGFTIYYGGQSNRVVTSASGWTIYGK